MGVLLWHLLKINNWISCTILKNNDQIIIWYRTSFAGIITSLYSLILFDQIIVMLYYIKNDIKIILELSSKVLLRHTGSLLKFKYPLENRGRFHKRS